MNKDYYNNWYQIEEFPNGPYEINKMGQIRNKRTKNILKPQIKNAGYLVCGVTELNPDGSHPKVAFRNTKEYKRAKKEYKL